MNVFFYIILFCMGTVFGSFLTLSSYRIPLNQDITHEHSYCPNCNHKLGFLDLIPVLSYIFLRGRCRYCHKKISPRYFIIEISVGILFVLMATCLKLSIYNLQVINLIDYGIGILYIIFLFLIACINKEHNYIDKRVLIYGIIISFFNVIYQYFTVPQYNMNRIILYYIMILILTFVDIKKIKAKTEVSNVINLLIFVIIINLFTQELTTIITIIFTLLILAFKLILGKIIGKKEENILKIPYFMSIANILTIIISVFYSYNL